jgi:hypothetical protein
MPSAGFEPAIPATKLSQTNALDRADTGIGELLIKGRKLKEKDWKKLKKK